MDITVVDDRDLMGFAASTFRTGEVTMTSVYSMVNNVMRAAGKKRIRRLNIIDHGKRIVKKGTDKTLRMVIQFGDDEVEARNLEAYRLHFERLQGFFTKNGFVHLQHCNAGEDLALVTGLSKMFGVPVFAGTGKHAPWLRVNFGDYVVCYPDGRAPRKDVDRPD